MMIPITIEQLRVLAPPPDAAKRRDAARAHAAYMSILADRDAILARYAINANPLRLAHFLAQLLHESGRFTVLTESLNYSAKALTDRYVNVKRPRMTGVQAAKLGRIGTAQKADQVAIANLIYGGEFGRKNGNTEPGDGWKFRGHGLPQLTWRSNFHRLTRRLREELGVGKEIDLEKNPELVLDPRFALHIACIFWKDGGCNAKADADTFKGSDERDNPALRVITHGWNGGYNGLEDRAKLLAETKAIYLRT